jgi:hypothetical protein
MPPVSRAGQINVTVDAFSSQATSNQLTVITPSITSFSPTHGPVGAYVILAGRFSSNMNYNKVFFNGVSAYVSSSSKSQITA